MNRTVTVTVGLASWLCTAGAIGQSGPLPAAAPANTQYSAQGGPITPGMSTQGGEPVSYASVSQLNGLLAQLEATSKSTQADLVKLRIEHWKADNASKKQALAHVDSIQRNLQGALPEIISELRNVPESVTTSFKLYRNLDALYDVLGTVTELAGAFGSKEDVQTLGNDLNSFENTRRQVAERIGTLSEAKEAEIVRLRADLKTAQAAIPVTPPKKVVVDDTEAPKKPVVKKKAAKPGTTPANAKPATGPSQSPSAGQTPPKPQ